MIASIIIVSPFFVHNDTVFFSVKDDLMRIHLSHIYRLFAESFRYQLPTSSASISSIATTAIPLSSLSASSLSASSSTSTSSSTTSSNLVSALNVETNVIVNNDINEEEIEETSSKLTAIKKLSALPRKFVEEAFFHASLEKRWILEHQTDLDCTFSTRATKDAKKGDYKCFKYCYTHPSTNEKEKLFLMCHQVVALLNWQEEHGEFSIWPERPTSRRPSGRQRPSRQRRRRQRVRRHHGPRQCGARGNGWRRRRHAE